MLIVASLSCILFFTGARWGIALYTALPIIWVLRWGYENAIAEHLSLGVPIRIDWPFVVLVAIFPAFPIVFHAIRMGRHRKKIDASNQTPGLTS